MKFPAYGKRLMQDRMAGKIPHNCVVVAFDWKIGAIFPRVVVQDDAKPFELEFRYLAGLDVIVAYASRNAPRVMETLHAVLRVNPRSLVAFHMDERKNFVVKNMAGEVML